MNPLKLGWLISDMDASAVSQEEHRHPEAYLGSHGAGIVYFLSLFHDNLNFLILLIIKYQTAHKF